MFRAETLEMQTSIYMKAAVNSQTWYSIFLLNSPSWKCKKRLVAKKDSPVGPHWTRCLHSMCWNMTLPQFWRKILISKYKDYLGEHRSHPFLITSGSRPFSFCKGSSPRSELDSEQCLGEGLAEIWTTGWVERFSSSPQHFPFPFNNSFTCPLALLWDEKQPCSLAWLCSRQLPCLHVKGWLCSPLSISVL